MDSNLATVEVTDDKYRILKHEPTKAAFDADGRSQWPLDQFTHRLVIEGAVRIVSDEPTALAPPPSLSKGN